MNKKIEKLIKLCKGSVTIYINEYRTDYVTIVEYLNKLNEGNDINFVPTELIQQCNNTGSIVEIIAYPHTPVGHYHAIAPTLSEAVTKVLSYIENENKGYNQ